MQYYISEDRNIEFVVTENITKDFNLHNHINHYVITAVVKGSALLIYNNVKVVVNEGDVFVMRPYMPHSVQINDQSQLLSLCIKKEILITNDCDTICQLIDSKFNTIADKINLNADLKDKFYDAVKFINNTISNERYILSSDIQKIADKIIEKSEEEFSLDDLSSEVYVSKYHLIRKFKAKIGLTPHQFLIQVRVRKAQQSIAEGNRLIDAAIDNGFYDSSHFNKCFDKIVGTTPSDFEQNNNII